jgi:hypothetical protein
MCRGGELTNAEAAESTRSGELLAVAMLARIRAS